MFFAFSFASRKVDEDDVSIQGQCRGFWSVANSVVP
jgi:hypothetical protein